jgi:phosphoglycerol transferase
MKSSKRRTSWLWIALSGILALLLFTLYLGSDGPGLLQALHGTSDTGGDVFFTGAMIRGLLRGEWSLGGLLRFRRIGAPFGTTLADFPMADSFHFAVIRVLALFDRDPLFLYNLYYYLGFGLAAATMTEVLLRWRVNGGLALASGVLYAFLPYHYYRYGHLFLASYYLLPLFVVYLLKVPRRVPLFFAGTKLCGRRVATFGIFALLFGSAGVYYSFFGCFLFMAIGLKGALALRRRVGPQCGTVLALPCARGPKPDGREPRALRRRRLRA